MKTIATLFLLVSAFQSLSVVLCSGNQQHWQPHDEFVMGQSTLPGGYSNDPWKMVCQDYLGKRPPFNQDPSGLNNNPNDFQTDNRQPNFPHDQFHPQPQLQEQFQGNNQPSNDPRELTPIKGPGYFGPFQLRYFGERPKFTYYNVDPSLIEYPRATGPPQGDISLTSPPANNDILKIIAKSNKQAIVIGNTDSNLSGRKALKTGTPGDLFIFKRSPKNTAAYNIHCKDNQKEGFNVFGGYKNQGTKIIIYPLTDHINEQFQVTPYTEDPRYFKLYSVLSNSCLQIGNDGRLEIYSCNGSNNQRFQLVKPAN